MISKCLAVVLFFLAGTGLHAQKGRSYTVQPGQKILEAIPLTDIYFFPDFTAGQVVYRNGKTGAARMNYNSLFNEIQFIAPAGDTLSLDDEETIRQIAFPSDTFYFSKGYLQQVVRREGIVLAKSRVIGFTNRRRIGGMGETSDASIETYTKISNGPLRDLVSRELLIFSEYVTFYISDEYLKFYPASRKNLIRLFGKHEKEIDRYLEETRVNFYKEEDMVRLARLVSDLERGGETSKLPAP